MPLYEYRCEACGELTEVIQRHGDPPLAVCPLCGGPLKKLLSAPAFQFKGSGWYVTDYARSGGGKSEGKPAGGGAGGADDGAAKTESGGKGAAGGKSAGGGQGDSAASAAPPPSTPPPKSGSSD